MDENQQPQVEVPIEKVLPERVGALFMLDNEFFRSPFMRDKLPPTFFSSGSGTFDRMFLTPDPFHRDMFGDDFFSLGSRRYSTDSSAFAPNPQNSGVIRHVPIRIEGSHMPLDTRSGPPDQHHNQPVQSESNHQTYHQNQSLPNSTIRKEVPIRFRDPDSMSVHSAQFPTLEKHTSHPPTMRRTQSSGRVSPTDDDMPFSSATLPPQPPQRRYFAQLLNKNRPGPTPPSSGGTSVNSFPLISESRVPSQHSVQSNGYIQLFGSTHDENGSISGSTASSATLGRASPMLSYRSVPITRRPSESVSGASKPESERPTTPKIRPKSPSLARLQQGLRKAHILPSCVRGNETSDESDDQLVRNRNSQENVVPIKINNSLTASTNQNQPTNFNGTSTRSSYIDPVEEAIRSLESFDPSKIIESVTSRKPESHTKELKVESQVRSSGSDTDSGSLIVRNTETTAADSPTSSGIVADITDEDYGRSNIVSLNNTSAYDLPSSDSSPVKSNPHPPPTIRTASPQKATISFPNRPGYLPMMTSNPVNLSEPPERGSPNRYQYRSPPQTNPYGTMQRTPSKPVSREPEYTPQVNEHDVSDEWAMRKRLLCTQMTDCSKVVEINAMKMSQYTAPSGWRMPHILQRSLSGIQDTVYTIEVALDELIECIGRISIDHADPKFEEYRQLTGPLKTSQVMIHRLRANLDATNWTLSALARMHNTPGGNDALDQFVAILYQLPKDCQKLVQWVYLLGTKGPPTTIDFLMNSSTPTPTFEQNQRPSMSPYANVHPTEYRLPHPFPTEAPSGGSQTSQTNSLLRDQKSRQTPTMEQNGRSTTQKFEPVRPREPSFTSSPVPYSEKYLEPTSSSRNLSWQNRTNSSQYVPPAPLIPPAPEEIFMDGGESTSSAGSTIEQPSPQPPRFETSKVESSGNSTPTARHNSQDPPTPTPMTATLLKRRGSEDREVVEEDDVASNADSRVVFEEDDLMSVASESVGSLYDDYAYVGEPRHPIPHNARLRVVRNQSKINPHALKDLTEEERELLKFYEPQLESHTANLCKLIEEFFTVVEEHQPPTKFVQKIRLIILEAQTLVYIGDNMAQCVANPALRAEFRQASDGLNSLLNQCVTNARRAKDEYPSVPAVHTMVNSVVSVSQAAQNLKLLGQSCA